MAHLNHNSPSRGYNGVVINVAPKFDIRMRDQVRLDTCVDGNHLNHPADAVNKPGNDNAPMAADPLFGLAKIIMNALAKMVSKGAVTARKKPCAMHGISCPRFTPPLP